jgi:hypothetical protein
VLVSNFLSKTKNPQTCWIKSNSHVPHCCTFNKSFYFNSEFLQSYIYHVIHKWDRENAQLRKLDLLVIPTVAKNYWRTITVYEMTLKLLNKAACFFPCCFFWVLEYIHGFVAMTVSRLKSFLKNKAVCYFYLN